MRHQHIRYRAWTCAAAAALCALLAGCAGIPLHASDQEVRDHYNAYAGEPIGQFTWLDRHFDSWQPVGRDELVLFTNPSDAYLIKVYPPCDNLQFVTRIGLTSTADTVSSRFDSVIVRQGLGPSWRCQIAEIRKVDYRRMKADMRLDAQRAREAKAAATAPQR